jgi:hypothetical protein
VPKGKNPITGAIVGNSSNALSINHSNATEKSDFDFAYLYVWDKSLTDEEMTIVSKKMLLYLKTGTYTADEILTDISFSDLMTSKPPSFIFSPSVASTLQASNTQMKDVRSGYPSYATMSGVTVNSGTGRGANGTITYLSGTASSIIKFPDGSYPTTYTICSITRYALNSANRLRIIQDSKDTNVVLGHGFGSAGVVYNPVAGWITIGDGTPSNNAGLVTDWVITCSRSNSSGSTYNVLIDAVPKANPTVGGIAGPTDITNTLAINIGYDQSDFDFAYLYVWDQSLTDAEMLTVSKKMLMYLKYGTM